MNIAHWLNKEHRKTDRLNRALDRVVLGRQRSVSAEFGAVGNRLFALAEVAGMRDREPAATGWRSGSVRFSTVAAVLSVFAVVALTVAVTRPDFGNSEPTERAIAVASPTDAIDEGLTPDDCIGEPRTREELVQILSQPPDPGAFLSRSAPQFQLADEEIEEAGSILKPWLACHTFNQTLIAMSYESEEFIRRRFYTDPFIVRAYSVDTINDMLDALEETDAILGDKLNEMDPNQIEPYPMVSIVAIVASYDHEILASTVSGQFGASEQEGRLILQLEGGSWRVAWDSLDASEWSRTVDWTQYES